MIVELRSFTAPGFLQLLGPQSSLRVLAFGGEACPSPATVAQWKHTKNSTRIFNIYGITEVSSWATCYELPYASDLHREQYNDPVDDKINALNSTLIVPLGDPLLDTCIELRDEQGSIISCGDGEIWIGMTHACTHIKSQYLHIKEVARGCVCLMMKNSVLLVQ